MANNDKILVDGIIDDRIDQKIPSSRRDEVFEYLASEQILKDYGLSHDEILSGVVDGRNDGGIDSIYVLVNGHLVSDVEDFLWPKSGCELSVFMVTCKHHDTFKLATVDSLVASLSEVLDFGVENVNLKADYNDDVLEARNKIIKTYRKTSPRLRKFVFDIYYASRGDSSIVGENIVSRSNQITELIKRNFSNVESDFHFYGSTEIVEAYRKAQIYSYDLVFQKVMSKGQTYLLLVSLSDYYDFITDSGNLKRFFFDSNVRAYMGQNSVNQDISLTLQDENSPDFWWLNNGVTILTTNSVVVGSSITIENVQIVNGLQTTESIYQHFNDVSSESLDDRSILIKVIVSNEDEIRDQIIRATNNQTVVDSVALFATDKIQRDIEDLLIKTGYYYERRTNYYKGQGIDPSKIVSPLYLASAVVSLCLKMPWTAAHFRSKLLRSEAMYDEVFNETPLEVFPIVAHLTRFSDAFMESRRSNRGGYDAYLRRYRFLLPTMVAIKLTGKFNFSNADLIKIDRRLITSELFMEMWNIIHSNKLLISNLKTSRKKTQILKRLFVLQSITGFDGIEMYKRMPSTIEVLRKHSIVKPVVVTEKIIQDVKLSLPPQPWPVGTHKDLAERLKINTQEVSAAIQALIERKEVMVQKDGVLYNTDGSVHSFDSKRVDPKTLRLKGE